MTPPDRQTNLHRALAFKAYEIEELADIYFFRPAGAIFAYAARALGMTPTAVSTLAGAAGVAGGCCLFDPRYGLAGFALLILHGVLDSSDGQLARLTGRASDFGKVVDGIAGYATYFAIYAGITAGYLARGGGARYTLWAIAGGLSTVLQAQMYDHFRITYTSLAIHGEVPHEELGRVPDGWARDLLRVYRHAQRRIIGSHIDVETAIARRAVAWRVTDDDRARYRASFYWLVRGWNVFGDNTRFYAIGLLAWFHHVEWFPFFVAVPLNLVLAALWVWQRRADRRFLAV